MPSSKHRNGERDGDPKAARHGDEFRIFFLFREGGARLECHAANRAGAGLGPHDFGMHRAGVFDARGGSQRHVGFQRHAALGTRAGMILANFGIHRADVRSARRRLNIGGRKPLDIDYVRGCMRGRDSRVFVRVARWLRPCFVTRACCRLAE